jgi:MOSC domain-containing protein YiiM
LDAPPSGRLDSINVSRGGVPKRPIDEAMITADGVEGDRQRDRRFHGGPERAVTLFSTERLAAMQSEGHPIAPGSTGENLTLSGIDWSRATPGARFEIGEARLEITRYATPCANIAGSFKDGEIARVAQKVNPGWSRVCARVLVPGRVRVGDSVLLLEPNAEHGGDA